MQLVQSDHQRHAPGHHDHGRDGHGRHRDGEPHHHDAHEAAGGTGGAGVSALWWSAPLRLAVASALIAMLWLVIGWALK